MSSEEHPPSARWGIARLTAESIGDNVALARSVGWADTEGDWVTLHEGARVFGVRAEGELVAQVGLGLYGRSGSVAKMIVAPRFQRQGFGQQLLGHLLAEADRLSVETLGLIATPFGRPLYEKAGFSPVGDVIVLAGTARVPSGHDPRVHAADIEAVVRFDEQVLQCTREAMLRARSRGAIATSAVSRAGRGLTGYAMATPGREQATIGPVIADTEDDARALVQSILARVPGPVRIDVPAEHLDFRRWLRDVGLQEGKQRPEMARGSARLPWQVPQRFALAAPAWG